MTSNHSWSRRVAIFLLAPSLFFFTPPAPHIYSATSSFPGYKGLIMAGYKGWFNAPGDGAGMGWNHYAKGGAFGPDSCKIDLWPEGGQYAKKYETPFRQSDGTPAYVFSSYDSQTVALHFKWMRDYGIDGVFIQRSVTALKDARNRHHDD